MHRTTITLDEPTAADLDRVAQSRGISRASVVREALRCYLHEVGSPQRELPGAGGYRSGRSDIAERGEELMAQVAGIAADTAEGEAP